MTTTPDSRIRADWTLPAETAAPPPTVAPDTSTTVTPDTSTTAGKIAVMQAAERGERIESTPRNPRDHAFGLWSTVTGMAWNWGLQDYRIAPPPVARTALQRARERTRVVIVDEATPGDVQLAMLVREVDYSPLVIISMRTVGLGDEASPYPTIVHLVDGDPKAMQPGRYRLVRDDQ